MKQTQHDDSVPAAAATINLQRRRVVVASSALLASSAAGALPPLAAAQAAPPSNAVSAGNDIVALDALALSAAIRQRQVSCREVMTAYLAQIARVNPQVNAIVALQDGDLLLRQADERDRQLAAGQYLGWMHGMPHAVKDLAATRGIVTTYGSPLFRQYVPSHDEIFVGRLRQQGAILIGKTNTPEFGLGSNTYNAVYGTTRNAYDTGRIAGGSSGGAAVALATRMVPVADGSDMMGSLRNPAAYNNVYGFRPSAGAVPNGPAAELYLGGLPTNGPMGRTISDLAMLMSTMAGYDARSPMSVEIDTRAFTQALQRDFKGSRIGWLGDLQGYLPMEDGVMAVCRNSFATLRALGCQIDEVDARQLGVEPARLWDSWLVHRQSLLAGMIGDAFNDPAKRALMKPEMIWEVEGGLARSAIDLYRASTERSKLYLALERLFERYDFLLSPTAQVFPFSVSQHWPTSIAGKTMDTYHRWMEVVIPASLAGIPALNVPAGFSPQGLPMGVQIMGRRFSDLRVLQLGHAYQEASHWERQRPAALIHAT